MLEVILLRHWKENDLVRWVAYDSEGKLTYSLTGYNQQRKSHRAHYHPHNLTRSLLLWSGWKAEKDETIQEFIRCSSARLLLLAAIGRDRYQRPIIKTLAVQATEVLRYSGSAELSMYTGVGGWGELAAKITCEVLSRRCSGMAQRNKRN